MQRFRYKRHYGEVEDLNFLPEKTNSGLSSNSQKALNQLTPTKPISSLIDTNLFIENGDRTHDNFTYIPSRFNGGEEGF